MPSFLSSPTPQTPQTEQQLLQQLMRRRRMKKTGKMMLWQHQEWQHLLLLHQQVGVLHQC
jgi:hypothetical protein